jgi:excinuclease ABC subunit B
MEEEMQKASAKLEFEKAAHLRDQIKELKKRAGMEEPPAKRKGPVDYKLAKKVGKGK